MLNFLKKLLTHTSTIQKMAGASFTIMGPLPSMGDAYALERAIRKLNLAGWMRIANRYNIELEVHGSFQAISELLQQIDHGKILQSRPRYEMMWLPHSKRYDVFVFNFFDPKLAKSS